MTTIILTILGVLLAAAAAIMAFWYGGDSFDAGSRKAVAATSVESIRQVSDAIQLYQLQEEAPPADVNALVSASYLGSVPSNPTGGNPPYMNSGYVIMTLGDDAEAVCLQIVRDVTHERAIPTNDLNRMMGCYRTSDGGYAAYSRTSRQ